MPATSDHGGTTKEPVTAEGVPSVVPDIRASIPAAPQTPTSKSQSGKPVKGVTQPVVSSSSASKLFATKKSPGSLAVGAAEGNLTLSGKTTSLYLGHTDPGNHVTNRGFCSWNRAADLSVAEADERCLAALQRQSAATEQKLTALALDAGVHTEALVNGTDLWNQSNQAGSQFALKYKQALDKGLKGSSAYIWARVEAFRNEAGILDASGLFGICAREPYYQNRLYGITPYTESWRWQCIALDQARRVGVVSQSLKHNIGATERERGRVGEVSANPGSNQSPPDPVTYGALSFEPVVVHSPIRLAPEVNSTSTPTGANVLRTRLANASGNNQLDFGVSEEDAAKSPQSAPSTPSSSQQALPMSDAVPLSFDPVPENNTKVVKPSNEQAGALQLDTGKPTGLGVDEWEPDLKKTPKTGDKIAGYVVTSPYGKRIHPLTGRSQFHGGVDVATPTNTNLYAIGSRGTKTTLTCWTDGNGGGLVATMTSSSFPSLKFDALHLTWCKAPTNGSKIVVDAGAIIGGTGSTGHSTGPHLHFQVRDDKSGDRFSPTKGQIWWALTGKKPKPSLK